MREDGDIEIKSTAAQLEEHIGSLVWEDMKAELRGWEEMVSSEYDEVNNLLDLGKIQGRLEALVYFMELPRVLHEIAKERQDESRRDKAE